MFARTTISCYVRQHRNSRSPRYSLTKSPACNSQRGKLGLFRSSEDSYSLYTAEVAEIDYRHRDDNYFLGSTNTRAETAEFFNVPPRTKGPSGVKRIPRVSARTSKVSSLIVSQRFPCSW